MKYLKLTKRLLLYWKFLPKKSFFLSVFHILSWYLEKDQSEETHAFSDPPCQLGALTHQFQAWEYHSISVPNSGKMVLVFFLILSIKKLVKRYFKREQDLKCALKELTKLMLWWILVRKRARASVLGLIMIGGIQPRRAVKTCTKKLFWQMQKIYQQRKNSISSFWECSFMRFLYSIKKVGL